jgi:hypothetical protein
MINIPVYFGRVRLAIGNTGVMWVRYQLLVLLLYFSFFRFLSFLLSLSLSLSLRWRFLGLRKIILRISGWKTLGKQFPTQCVLR